MKLLSCSERTLQSLRDNGLLPYSRPFGGSKIFYLRSDVLKLLESGYTGRNSNWIRSIKLGNSGNLRNLSPEVFFLTNLKRTLNIIYPTIKNSIQVIWNWGNDNFITSYNHSKFLYTFYSSLITSLLILKCLFGFFYRNNNGHKYSSPLLNVFLFRSHWNLLSKSQRL